MQEDVINLETAKLAHEKGFKAIEPTHSLFQKWLRELRTPIIVTPTTDFVAWEVQIQHPDKGLFTITKNSEDRWFNSYEEALEAGLLEALKLI